MKPSETMGPRMSQLHEAGHAPAASRASTDQQLLVEYASTQSERAFAEIVARHAGFVYSAALRQTQNQTVAEEITQAVFVILARKAPALRRETAIQGWLFRAIRYAAMDFRKVEARRIRREREAAQMHSTDTREESESTWKQMAPWIDEALASLSARDREAVLLRFFEGKCFRDIGETFGGNENAARLRVVRAVEKLRGFFQKRGLVLSAGLLSSSLLAQPAQAAPPALISSVMGMVASGDCPASVTVFIRPILWRTWLRRWILWTGGLGVAFFIVLAFIGLPREDRLAAAREARATTTAIDGAISFGDAEAFIAHLRFRTAEEERFKPVFANFIRASVKLRQQVRESFDAQPVRARIWLWAVEQLFQGQPRRDQNSLPAGRITDDFFQPYLMVMVKDGIALKWDFFASLRPDVVKERMKVLREKTEACERVTRQIQEGEITSAEQALALIQEHSP
jgi:RNA polymerase sigma factor (sigma-70 family)